MKFKTKVAYSAVLATLGMAAGTAQAAFLSEQGTGQILFYPYYTVQGGMDTYISVVNTTSNGKAVKVRILEGRASKEVLDFNLYLSPKDVWTAAITNSVAGSTTAAGKIVTTDKSCTVPKIMAPTDPVTGALSESVFRNLQYAGKDNAYLSSETASVASAIARTREGYIEMIEMGTITTTASGSFGWAITHTNGVPNDCAWVTNLWKGVTSDASNSNMPTALAVSPPSGGLIGAAALINTASGVDYSYDPVALEDFNSTSTALHYSPGSLNPSVNNATPTSFVIDGTIIPSITTTQWDLQPAYVKADPISAVLMRSNVMNEYTVNTDLAASTDWVVTFPTKNKYVTDNSASAVRPFTIGSGVTSGSWKACEPVDLARYNREEAKKGAITGVDFSPQPDQDAGPCLPWEANVLSWGTSNVLGSLNVRTAIADVYSDGWVDLTFSAAAKMGSSTGTFTGLPVIGFSVQKYVDARFNGAVGNYGGAYIHKYVRTITNKP